MSKQGLKGTQGNPFLYQELTSGRSSAIGLDSADNKLKVSVSPTADTDPQGTTQIEVDPATDNVELPSGDLLMTEIDGANRGISKIRFAPAAIGQNQHDIYFYINNIFMGSATGNQTGTGLFNIAIGIDALQSYTTGERNTAVGHASLQNCTIGGENSCLGYTAGNFITTGSENICIGHEAGISLTTGSRNIVIESVPAAGIDLADSDNIIIGDNGVSGDNNTIRIGALGSGNNQQNRCFIGGIRGITTGNADAIAVLIDSASQLGTVSSSIRHKENIEDLGATTDKIYDLRPVSFNYKIDDTKRRQYGLIAEEVKEIYPDLVVNDEEGVPLSIKYQDLPVLLLN